MSLFGDSFLVTLTLESAKIIKQFCPTINQTAAIVNAVADKREVL
jgi:hypothetical protein